MRGVGSLATDRIGYRTVVIDVCFLFDGPVVFSATYFHFLWLKLNLQAFGMKIGEAHQTQSSSLYSANAIGAPMHPAPIGVADRTRKKIIGALCLVSIAYWRRGHRSANKLAPLRQYIGAPMSLAPSINAIILNRQCVGIIEILKKRRTEPFGAPHLFS